MSSMRAFWKRRKSAACADFLKGTGCGNEPQPEPIADRVTDRAASLECGSLRVDGVATFGTIRSLFTS